MRILSEFCCGLWIVLLNNNSICDILHQNIFFRAISWCQEKVLEKGTFWKPFSISVELLVKTPNYFDWFVIDPLHIIKHNSEWPFTSSWIAWALCMHRYVTLFINFNNKRKTSSFPHAPQHMFQLALILDISLLHTGAMNFFKELEIYSRLLTKIDGFISCQMTLFFILFIHQSIIFIFFKRVIGRRSIAIISSKFCM